MRTRIEIAVPSTEAEVDELRSYLRRALRTASIGKMLAIEESAVKFRSWDAAIVVAIVGAAGAGLAALINALIAFAREKALRRIVLQSRDGSRLEFPADLSAKEVDALVERVGAMAKDGLRIELGELEAQESLSKGRQAHGPFRSARVRRSR